MREAVEKVVLVVVVVVGVGRCRGKQQVFVKGGR